MKTRYFITAAAALLLGATASLAQPSYPIFRTGDKITVDGVLGEASWQSAPKLSDLADIRDDKSLPLPTKNTTIKGGLAVSMDLSKMDGGDGFPFLLHQYT